MPHFAEATSQLVTLVASAGVPSLRLPPGTAILAAMVALVLASTSPYRKALLERLGVPFECVAPGVDEEKARGTETSPIAIARLLARAKATAVSKLRPDAVVIGSDQVCALDETVLGKPGSKEGAEAQLKLLRGKSHLLITAVAVQHGSKVEEFVDVTTLRMRDLTDEEVRRYVELDQPVDCAGSYMFERAGVALFDRVEGEDHTAIVGLPLVKLCGVLTGFGVGV